MNPLDVIIADGVRIVLEDDLGRVTYKKIEKEIRNTHGTRIQEAVSDFAKLDLVLRKFFGRHAASIEFKAFKKVIILEKEVRDGAILGITEPTVAKGIFDSYGDPAKRAILDAMKTPTSIADAISTAGLSKASAYGRIKEMLNGGLLSMTGHSKAKDGRRVNTLQATLRSAMFNVHDGGVRVSAGLGCAVLDLSFAYNSIVQTRTA